MPSRIKCLSARAKVFAYLRPRRERFSVSSFASPNDELRAGSRLSFLVADQLSQRSARVSRSSLQSCVTRGVVDNDYRKIHEQNSRVFEVIEISNDLASGIFLAVHEAEVDRAGSCRARSTQARRRSKLLVCTHVERCDDEEKNSGTGGDSRPCCLGLNGQRSIGHPDRYCDRQGAWLSERRPECCRLLGLRRLRARGHRGSGLRDAEPADPLGRECRDVPGQCRQGDQLPPFNRHPEHRQYPQ